MSKTKVFSMHLLLLVLLVSSCSRKEETLYEPGKGGVRIDLTTELPATRAELDTVANPLKVDDFKVEIINSKGVIFKRWNTYAEYKSGENAAFHMNAGGPYTLRATYGDSLASGWSAWFFKGESTFTVPAQDVVSVSAVCRMANIKVAVAYGEDMLKDYQEYKTTVTGRRGSLVFDMAHKDEAGYMPADPLTVDVELTDHDGKKWYFRNSAQVQAAPGDFITLNLNTKAEPEQELGLSLTVDYGTNDVEIPVDISTALPTEAPSISSLEGFDAETGALPSFIEGIMPEAAAVNFTWDARATLASCRLKVTSSYFDEYDLPKDVDLCAVQGNQGELLRQHGIEFPDFSKGLTGQQAGIEFEQFAQNLAYNADAAANTHTFEITVTDNKGKSVSRTVTVAPAQASKSVTVQPAGMWARRAYISLSTDGDAQKLGVQYQKHGSSAWTDPQTADVLVDGGTKTLTVLGLEPGTNYTFRAVYNKYQSEATEVFTTEVEQQVGNAGFEEWTTETHSFVYNFFGKHEHNIDWDLPWTNDQWWAVNSKKTMPSSTSVASDNWNWVRFPTVAYTTDANSDGKAAMIYSVNVGDWLTSSAIVGDRVAGELFIGTADDNGNHSSDGHDFGNRPDVMRFYFKYQPVNSETFYVRVELRSGSDVIASAERDDVGLTSSWTPMDIPLVYTDETQKATSIYIIFKSTTAEKPEVTGNYNLVIRDGKSEKGNFGSILYVDDIELIYE